MLQGSVSRAATVICAGILSLAATAILSAPATATPTVDGVFDVPGEFDTNDKIVAGPDGNMWLTLSSATQDVARITPAGEVTEYNLPDVPNSPGGIATDGQNLWVTFANGLASFSPGDPVNTDVAFEVAAEQDNPLIVGPDGNLWIAKANEILRAPLADPKSVTKFSVPGLAPKDIEVAGQSLVVADSGGGNRIVSATTAGVTTDISIEGPSQGVAGNPSGQFLYTVPDKGVGLSAPGAAPLFSAFPGSDTFGATLGSDGAYWVAEGFGEKLIRLTPDNQATTLGGLPAGFVSRQIATGPNNTLWVTVEIPVEDTRVVRVTGVEPAVIPISAPPVAKAPRTRIVRGPKKKVRTKRKRVKVKFRFKSPDAGARFECALVKIKKRRKGKAGPRPRFRGCRAPRAYRVRPGRYRFLVRAVLAGVADPSPARRAFRVIRVR